MNKLVRLFVLFPFLIGCDNKSPVTFKLKVEYNPTDALIEVNPEYMYKHAITDSVTSIYYVGDETCTACKELKPQLEAWCEVYHGAIYYIPVSTIKDEEQLEYLKNATHYEASTPYSWEGNSSVPAVFFMMDKYIVQRTDQTNTMFYLTTYVEVLPQNS